MEYKPGQLTEQDFSAWMRPRDWKIDAAGLMIGVKIVVSEYALIKVWVYPKERFWTYIPSPETEKWCRFFGFGHEETRPGAYQVGDTLVVHPIILDAVKKHDAVRVRSFELPQPGFASLINTGF